MRACSGRRYCSDLLIKTYAHPRGRCMRGRCMRAAVGRTCRREHLRQAFDLHRIGRARVRRHMAPIVLHAACCDSVLRMDDCARRGRGSALGGRTPLARRLASERAPAGHAVGRQGWGDAGMHNWMNSITDILRNSVTGMRSAVRRMHTKYKYT